MTKILLISLVVFVTGCSLFQRHNSGGEASLPPKEEQPPASSVEKALTQEEAPPQETSDKDAQMKIQIKKINDLAENEKKPSPKLEGVPPETALKWLKHGNTRFVKGYLRKDGQTKKDILRVAGKQQPHAIIFSSSDSRVPPEIVFDQKLGEVFVIRNLDGAMDASVISSIEYAVQHFGTRLLVLLGPAGNPEQKERVLTNLEKMKTVLSENSELLKEKIGNGEFVADIAVYDLKTGQVDFK